MSINNPAGRLLRILQEGRTKPEDIRVSSVWAELLEVPADDFPELLRRIGLVQQLPYLIRNEIYALNDIDTELHLNWLPKVELAFSSAHLRSPWRNFINHIDDSTILGLSFCDDKLARKEKSGFTRESVHEFSQEAEEIRGAILKSDLEEPVHQFLLRQVELLKQSLDDYELRGPEAISDALQLTIGSITINQNVYHDSTQTSLGIKLWKFVERLVLVSTLVVNSMTMIEASSMPLGLPHNNSDPDKEEELSIHSRAVLREDRGKGSAPQNQVE